MPSNNQHNEQADAIPNPAPEIAAEHGENPGRFLVEDLRVDGGDGTTGELMLARIRGLETIALCRFWVMIERRLADLEGRDPREKVVDALEERERHLEEHGDGLAQAGLSREERRDRAADRDSQSVAVLVDENGQEIPWSRQTGATVRASQ